MDAIRSDLARRKGIAPEQVSEGDVTSRLEWMLLILARAGCAVVDARLVREHDDRR